MQRLRFGLHKIAKAKLCNAMALRRTDSQRKGFAQNGAAAASQRLEMQRQRKATEPNNNTILHGGRKMKQLAAELGKNPKYVSGVLNGHYSPKKAEEEFNSAFQRIVEQVHSTT